GASYTSLLGESITDDPMKNRITVVFALCVVSMGTCKAPAAESAADPFLECVKGFTSEAHFAVIAAKLPLTDINHITFNMLADQSKPTPQEREDIAEWF